MKYLLIFVVYYPVCVALVVLLTAIGLCVSAVICVGLWAAYLSGMGADWGAAVVRRWFPGVHRVMGPVWRKYFIRR